MTPPPEDRTPQDLIPQDLDAALRELGPRRPLLIASDYDGVLSPLVGDPSAAVPEPGVSGALARLAGVEGVTVAMVSGRGVRDLQEVSGFPGDLRWVGSHGAELDGPLTGELADRRDALVRLLEPLVDGVPGARLEVKPASVAVHVREVVDRSAATTLLGRADALADPSLTKKPGKEVLELAVTDADKGTALRRLRAEVSAAGAVYLGDDVTDEDGFRALEPGDVTVKVGDGETAARFRVADTTAAVAVVQRLADLLDG
jgi:trehalose 6-phosphate phosphatase